VGEALPTLLASERFLSRVDPLVPDEQRPLREALLALGALVELLSRVSLLVDDEVGALPEALPALAALVGLLPGVDPLVDGEVGALSEAPPALVARVPLLLAGGSVLGFGFWEDLLVSSTSDGFIPFQLHLALRSCVPPRGLQKVPFPLGRCHSVSSPSLGAFALWVRLFLRSSGCGSRARATSQLLRGNHIAPPLCPPPRSLKGG